MTCDDVIQNEVMFVAEIKRDVIFNIDDGRRDPRMEMSGVSAHDRSRVGAVDNVLESGGEMSTATP